MYVFDTLELKRVDMSVEGESFGLLFTTLSLFHAGISRVDDRLSQISRWVGMYEAGYKG